MIMKISISIQYLPSNNYFFASGDCPYDAGRDTMYPYMRFKIATFNFWGLPWPFSVRKKARLRMLVEMIRREQFDVIALQELFVYRDITFLVRQLPEYSNSGQSLGLFNRSGLFLLARQPLTNCTIVPFNVPLTLHEFPSRKGVQKSDITLGGQNFQLINTHVAYTPRPTDEKIQERQLDQLVRTLETLPTFLFGDFNRVYDTLGLPLQFRLISEDKKSSISMSNRYARFFLNRVGMSDRLPDYIFTNSNVRVAKTYFITDPIMSDHYPVVSEIDV